MNESVQKFVKWLEDVPAIKTNGLLKLKDNAPERVKKEAMAYDAYFFERTGRHKFYWGKVKN